MSATEDRRFADVAARIQDWHEGERHDWLARMDTLTALIDGLCRQQATGLPHERAHARHMLNCLETQIGFLTDCLDGSLLRD